MPRFGIASLLILLSLAGAHAGRAPEKARPLQLPDLVAQAPASWTPVPPAGATSRFRRAHYRLPRAAADTTAPELIVFYFGPGEGGSAPANIERWRGMFETPAGGAAAKPAVKTRAGLRITTIDLTGTYKDRPAPMAPTFTRRPNYRMLAAIVETTRSGGQGPYFLRLVGPAKSVAAQKSAWDAFLASLRVK